MNIACTESGINHPSVATLRQGHPLYSGSGFVPAMVVVDAPTEAPVGSPAAGRMEIVALTGRRVIVGSDVDVAALARVLDVVERR